MKPKYRLLAVAVLAASSTLVWGGCSSSPAQGPKPIELSADAPTVVNARSEPALVLLNSDLQPMSPAQVVADVKDFNARVVDVRLKFTDVPIEVPMENVGGTTWRAELTPQELQMLAISGKTIRYKTTIIAKDSSGNTSSSSEPVYVAVKAPNVAQYG